MARRQRLAALVAAVLVMTAAVACDRDAAPLIHGDGAPGIDEVAINAAVLDFMGDNGVEGATVAVTRAERLVWSKAYGFANKEDKIPMQPGHRSRIGSVSKVITAIALLRMMEPDAIGGLSTGPTGSLAAKLALKVYGYPGSNWTSTAWPNVTEPTALANPNQYWEAIRDGVQNFYPDTFDTDMARMIDWASSMELGHLLSHSSGLPRSGSTAAAASAFGVDESEVTYPQVHKAVLMAVLGEVPATRSEFKCYLGGELYVEPPDDTQEEDGDDEAPADDDVPTYPLPGLLYKPGTDSCYSNHAFGLVGHIIDEQAGALTYPELVTQSILQPLGLTDVVVNNTAISELDAWPHGSTLDETDVSDSPATGGWSATAQDMVRIMCGLDAASNNLRLLQPQTVTTMESVAYPEAGSAPLGWDTRYDLAVTKNGSIAGGHSQITKYLPGRFDTAPDDEINVAVNVNSSAASPPIALLRTIAATVAAADIPDDYDLFDPAYACVVPPETPQEPGLAIPQQTLTATPAPPPIAVPTAPSPTPPPSPPTVTIRQPGSGQHIAPNGVASIAFSGLGRSADGTTISGTHYRWTLAQAGTKTVVCTGSEFDTGAAPTIGGIAAVVDCTSFARTLHNPYPGAGPPITIRLEVQDPNGTSADTTVAISLVTPPVG